MGKYAVFTVARDERVFLPLWLRYYSRYFDPPDIYVYDHRSTDGSVEAARRRWRFRRVAVGHPAFNDFPWYTAFVRERQRRLLARYRAVLFAEPDEILWHADGLDRYLRGFTAPAVRASGFQVWHDRRAEPPLDPGRTVLAQRRHCFPDPLYCKPLLARVPLRYSFGFHAAPDCGEIDPDLHLYHLHAMDYDLALAKHERTRRYADYDPLSRRERRGFQGLLVGEAFAAWFDGLPAGRLQPIPETVRRGDAF